MNAHSSARTILISGLSGSGKTVALRALEDAGYYCVDNLPARFVAEMIDYLASAGHERIGLNVDVRSGDVFSTLPTVVRDLAQSGLDIRLLFLEASTESIVKRFSETRRPHPLADADRTLPECIGMERTLLEDLAELGHRIDTSDLPPNQLRTWVREFVELDQSRLTLFFQSFGFKHGIPLDADYVFDVRCLPNPYYDQALRPLTGRDPPVVAFLEQLPATGRMLADIGAFLERWVPVFVRDHRASLTVALGCTGGQHRSVYCIERLAERFREQYQVLVRHRELRG
jgi:RNase adapter protein RapZ